MRWSSRLFYYRNFQNSFGVRFCLKSFFLRFCQPVYFLCNWRWIHIVMNSFKGFSYFSRCHSVLANLLRFVVSFLKIFLFSFEETTIFFFHPPLFVAVNTFTACLSSIFATSALLFVIIQFFHFFIFSFSVCVRSSSVFGLIGIRFK